MQTKMYLCVRQKGIVRLTNATPAHIEGVFFEHLITCLGLCLRSPDNHRMSFIHMDAGIDLQSIDDEIAWVNHSQWELITFTNKAANDVACQRNKCPPDVQTENILLGHLKKRQWLLKNQSHWKKRVDTKTSVAIIDRNFKCTTQISKDIDYIYFKNDKLVEAIDFLNNCFESICKNGLLTNQRNALRIDYDGSAEILAEPTLKLPPLLRRPLQLISAIIPLLPKSELKSFRCAKDNPECFNIIAGLTQKLLHELFDQNDIQPVIRLGARFAPDIALVLQEYFNHPQGDCAKSIDGLLSPELNDTHTSSFKVQSANIPLM